MKYWNDLVLCYVVVYCIYVCFKVKKLMIKIVEWEYLFIFIYKVFLVIVDNYYLFSNYILF